MSDKRKILLGIFIVTVTSTSLIFASDISSLIRDLGNKEKAKDASAALAKIGEPSVPALIKALEGRNKYRKRYAARAIREMGQPGSKAIPALVKLLKEWDVPTREYAVEALGNMVLQAPQVLPILEKAKKDRSKDVAKKSKLAIEKIKAAFTDGEKLAEIVKYRLNLNNVGKKCTSLVLEEESPNQYKGVAEFEDGLKSQVVVKVLGAKVQYSFGDEFKTYVKKAHSLSFESASKEAREAKSSESKKVISQKNEIILLRSEIKQLEETVRSQRQIIERLNGELAESRKKLEDIAKNVQIVRVDDSTEKTKKSLFEANPLVAGVMYSTLPGYEVTTIGKAFNSFFANPKWELRIAKNGAKFVEFSGQLKETLRLTVYVKLGGPLGGGEVALSWEKGTVLVTFALSHDSTSFNLWAVELPPTSTGFIATLRNSEWEDSESMEKLLRKIYALK